MRKLFLFALLSLASFGCYAQSSNVTASDTITTAPVEMWEYKTIYVHNTHQNARQGEVEFKLIQEVMRWPEESADQPS